MRYSYEYKQKAVELYKEGRWPETPEGIKSSRSFRLKVRRWARMVEANGPEVLKHTGHNKYRTPEEKMKLVQKVLDGKSITSVALEAGMYDTSLSQWVRKYKIFGYNGLVYTRKGRRPENPDMKKMNINNPRKLEESEYEELIRLRAENAYIKSEIEIIKKEIALREEKEAARLKAKKQQSSKSSGKRDIS